uniref:Uncharacterized protein n=1 Tax=Oryza rufipogon TaxID=4529 RepID=A0A0E0QIN4_ORYRU
MTPSCASTTTLRRPMRALRLGYLDISFPTSATSTMATLRTASSPTVQITVADTSPDSSREPPPPPLHPREKPPPPTPTPDAAPATVEARSVVGAATAATTPSLGEASAADADLDCGSTRRCHPGRRRGRLAHRRICRGREATTADTVCGEKEEGARASERESERERGKREIEKRANLLSPRPYLVVVGPAGSARFLWVSAFN